MTADEFFGLASQHRQPANGSRDKSARPAGGSRCRITSFVIATVSTARHLRVVSARWAFATAAMDLFVVPTLAFKLLYGFVILRLDRRDIVWIGVTTSPTAEWIARQITEAFPWDSAPGYLIRDRDCVFGSVVRQRLHAMGIRDKPIAPLSPWQNGFAERLVGSIRRECLDHIIVFGEEHLRRVLQSYACYYNGTRTHRSLEKDAPVHRPIQRIGALKSRPILGGLHHQYIRI